MLVSRVPNLSGVYVDYLMGKKSKPLTSLQAIRQGAGKLHEKKKVLFKYLNTKPMKKLSYNVFPVSFMSPGLVMDEAAGFSSRLASRVGTYTKCLAPEGSTTPSFQQHLFT